MSDDRQDWSLRKEIQKRKAEQAERDAAARRAAQRGVTPPPSTSSGSTSGTPAKPAAPRPSSTGTSSTSGGSRPRPPARGGTGPLGTASTPSRATQSSPQPARKGTGPLGAPPRPSRSTRSETVSSGEMFAGERRRLPRSLVIIIGLVALLGIISLVILLLVPPAAPPLPTLGDITAADVVAYLEAAGVPITNRRPMDLPGGFASAQQGFQFNVLRDNERGNFIVLSYHPREPIGLDSLHIANTRDFGRWSQFSEGNILVLSSPNTSEPIRREVESHLTTFLRAPYSAFFPTSTGSPIAIALQATPNIQPTQPGPARTIVTLPPRTPEGFTPSPLVPIRPTSTLRPESPTPEQSPTPRGIGLGNLIPTNTATPEGGIPIDPTRPIVTAPPSVPTQPRSDGTPVSLAPTVEPVVENSAQYNERVPKQVGPFRLDPAQSTTNANGSTLMYVTRDGLSFLVVLWITQSPEQALERYSIDRSAMQGDVQAVQLGDEAVITGPGNWVLAMVRSANMVLIIYRPDYAGTTPVSAVGEDQLLALMTELFNAIPR